MWRVEILFVPRFVPEDIFTRYISASLTVVYYSGTGVVPKSNCRQRNSNLSNIFMQVDMVVVFVWIWK